MGRRKAAGAYYYFAAIAAALLLLLPNPSRVSGQPVPTPNSAPSPTPAPPAKGFCDDVWSVPGFNFRYMAYDVVVANRSLFGPEVKGRVTSEVMQELHERLCTDDSVLYDLQNYGTFGYVRGLHTASRRQEIRRFASFDLEYRAKLAQALFMRIQDGSPYLATSVQGFDSWVYTKGSSTQDVPFLGAVSSAPQKSVFLVYTADDHTKRYLRLECGFQPTRLK